jgi:hypothetical protein
MTDRDKKTIRIAIIGIAIYLSIFGGVKLWKKGATGRDDSEKLAKRAAQLQSDLRAQENKILLYEKLTELYKLDPRKIKKESLVADASAAIQTAAQQGGIKLGPLRETAGRATSRELSTIQVEGSGQVTAALGLIHRLQTLGFPLIIDQVQLSPAQGQPGQLKISLTVIILNYDQWKETPNA